ncbi:RNA polymerase sigma factor [Lentzea sp. NPDC051213]|uniref:RNA polymerase sigma factor n=1 Tax=Lentzea sp. NPDC051213 TaxID=3364126 RepID=UPI0037A830E4
MTDASEFNENHGPDYRRTQDAYDDLYGRDWGAPVRLDEYTSFYRAHQRKVLTRTRTKARRVAHHVGAGIDVEGAVQEAFIAFWRHLSQCEARGVPSKVHTPGAWVAKVAWFHVIRQVDRGAVQQQKLVDVLSNAMQFHRTPLGDPVFTAVLAAEAVEQILALPGNQKLVAYLRFVEEWSNDEIADVLGVSSSTVRVHAFRARGNFAGRDQHIGDRVSGDMVGRDMVVWSRASRAIPLWVLRWGLLGAAGATAAVVTLVLYAHVWMAVVVAGAVALLGRAGWALTHHIVSRRRLRRFEIARARKRKDIL